MENKLQERLEQTTKTLWIVGTITGVQMIFVVYGMFFVQNIDDFGFLTMTAMGTYPITMILLLALTLVYATTKKKLDKTIESNTYVFKGKMMYESGGYMELSRITEVTLTDKELTYGEHSIALEDIQGVSVSTQTQVSEIVKSRVTATRMATMGVFALAMPKHKQQTVDNSKKFLAIEYNDFGDNGVLVLSGGNITTLEARLRKVRHDSKKK